jgi:hypothetical protein
MRERERKRSRSRRGADSKHEGGSRSLGEEIPYPGRFDIAWK